MVVYTVASGWLCRAGGRASGRFHFVSLPACGGAIAAALCQSVTLSRHPFSLSLSLAALRYVYILHVYTRAVQQGL